MGQVASSRLRLEASAADTERNKQQQDRARNSIQRIAAQHCTAQRTASQVQAERCGVVQAATDWSSELQRWREDREGSGVEKEEADKVGSNAHLYIRQ